METVAEGQLWRQGPEGQPRLLRRINVGMAELQEPGKLRAPGALVPVASLAAGDGGWERMPTLAQLMEKHSISELAARRVTRGESVRDAVRAAEFFSSADWPEDVHNTDHWLDVYYDESAKLAPNPDAIAYIVEEARDRIEEDRPRQPEEREELKGVRKVIRDLRDARGLLDQHGVPFLSHLAQQQAKLIDLLQAASEHLDELHGPVVDLWRCDTCGNVVPDVLLERELDSGAIRLLRATIVHKDETVYVECENWNPPDGMRPGESAHGPMRHVRCRVTADDPDFEAEPATPEVVES